MSEGDAGWNGAEDYFAFGLPILKDRFRGSRSTRASRLSNLLSSRRGEIAWFGYEKREAESPALAIWFYCGTSAAKQKLLAKLERSKVGKIDHLDLDVRVACDAAESLGDKGWFLKVFDALVPKTSA